jgi:asparagine synthase (glutamine-hydrolysing)
VKVLLEGQGGDELLAGYPYYREDQPRNGLSQDLTREICPEVLNDDFLNVYKNKKTDAPPKPFRSPLLNAQYKDIKYTKLPRVLRFNDRISMAASRELRVPYLDHRIVEYCFFLPRKYKLNAETSKKILRDAMSPFIPRVVRHKPKVVFGAVQPHWFRKYLRDEILDILHSQTFRGRPYWDHEKTMEKAKLFFAGEGENSFFIWQWIILEMWLRKYIDRV